MAMAEACAGAVKKNVSFIRPAIHCGECKIKEEQKPFQQFASCLGDFFNWLMLFDEGPLA